MLTGFNFLMKVIRFFHSNKAHEISNNISINQVLMGTFSFQNNFRDNQIFRCAK